MSHKTSSMIRFDLGFIIAIIGVGLLINRSFVGLTGVQIGIIMQIIGLLLILTCKIHIFKEN